MTSKLLSLGRWFAAIILVALVFGCSTDGGEDVAVITIPDSVLADGISFDKEGGTKTLNFTSTAEVTVTPSVSWITASLKTSTANGTMVYNIIAEANPSASDRSASLTVAAGTVSQVVYVYQSAAYGLSVASDTVNLDSSEAATFTVIVNTNGSPEISLSNSWISQVSTKTNPTDNEYYFAVTTNYGTERTGTITFTLDELTAVVTVIQASGASDSDEALPTAKEIASKMYCGVNIGNTLEATGGETSWGNPKVTATYVAGLKALGFNAVRIPCAWYSCHLEDASTYKIKTDWLERVSEVVGYCVDNDMYAIVNIHWDGGWLEDSITSTYNETIGEIQRTLWTQIADYLNSYDEHLLFAGMNEPGMNQSITSSAGTKVIMAYQQDFVDAVRATGGNNASRTLICQGVQTDISTTVSGTYWVPDDTIEDRMMAEVHYYDPYQFTLMEEDASWGVVAWYWGSANHVSGSSRNATWGEEDWVASQMASLKSYFVDKGVPCIIGEFCASKKTDSGIDSSAHNASRELFNRVVVREAKNNGCVPFYWETGVDINRSTGAAREQYAIDGLMAGAAEGVYPW